MLRGAKRLFFPAVLIVILAVGRFGPAIRDAKFYGGVSAVQYHGTAYGGIRCSGSHEFPVRRYRSPCQGTINANGGGSRKCGERLVLWVDWGFQKWNLAIVRFLIL